MKTRRLAAGFSLAAFARAIGMSQTVVSRYEKPPGDPKAVRPSPGVLRKMLEVFGFRSADPPAGAPVLLADASIEQIVDEVSSRGVWCLIGSPPRRRDDEAE